MKTPIICYLALVLLGAPAAAIAQDQAGDLAIITNKAAKLENVAMADLRRYFKAEKSKTPDGTKLVLAMFDLGHAERTSALREIYGMSENEYADYFVEATFTGAVTAAPKNLPSPAAVKAFVAATPGAISYVRGSDVDDSVRIVKVDGKLPGEADYKLKMK